MFNKALFLALALAVMPAAVASKTSTSMEKKLQASLKTYELAVRWNDFEAASQAMDPLTLQGERFSEQDEAYYKVFQITGYMIKSSSMGEDLIYTQRVELRIVDQDTQAERTKTDRQSWRYDAAAKRWWLTSGLPKLD
jgi:type II secretory pathway pseudopilin PulG